MGNNTVLGAARMVVDMLYPTASDAELDKGARWMVRRGDGSASELSTPEVQQQLEAEMFGPGDHSAKRTTRPRLG